MGCGVIFCDVCGMCNNTAMETRHVEVEETPTDAPKHNWLGVGLSLLLAAGAFFSGIQVGSGESTNVELQAGIFSIFAHQPSAPIEADLTEFWRVWDILDEKFVTSSSSEGLTTEEKIRGAIDGLVASYGDPYTVYFPPKDATAFQDEISGNFGGVGMEVGIRDRVVTVIAPLPETPAQHAGVVSGDKIIEIDGKTTEKMNIDEAVQLIRGEVGTVVTLTIYRQGETDFLTIPITRDTITIPTIDTYQQGDTFIIALYSFNALSESKMKEAMQAYEASGASSLVLDLRDNPGGYLQSAVTIASYFIPAGKVIVRENFGDDRPEELYRSQGRTLGTFTPENFAVIINGGSASAAEILAGALKEHNIATVIGESTFGKGSVQELVDLPDKASLKITIARWFTPDGHSISAGGLDPSIEVVRTPQEVIDDIDPQLDAAIKWLAGDRSMLTASSSVPRLLP